MGGGEVMLILLAALFLFGGKKLPELARGLGRGIREFKDASESIKKDINDQINSFGKDLDVPDSPDTSHTTSTTTGSETEEDYSDGGHRQPEYYGGPSADSDADPKNDTLEKNPTNTSSDAAESPKKDEQ